MGCGASSQAAGGAASENDEGRPSYVRTSDEHHEPQFHMVTDMNGDKAYVAVYDNEWSDMTAYEHARTKAMAAEVAADAGALRSVLKFTVTSPERLRSQKRVLSCSCSAADLTDTSSNGPVEVRLGALQGFQGGR